DRVRNTAILALVTIALLLPLSVVLGAVAGIRPGGSVDQTISLLTLAGIAVPEFVVGTLLIFVFALTLGLLPPISLVPPGATPLDNPRVLVLPVLTLLLLALGLHL